ncbi:MAG: YceI family protein [Gemmatimonadales bacterium]|nr:MAG: YceI family protein [Gemmatimonadales bacterium]
MRYGASRITGAAFTVLVLAAGAGLIEGGIDDGTDSVRASGHAVPDTTFRVVPDESLVAVVTRRAGPAARLAHDHLVHAERFETRLTFDPDHPTEARFELELDVVDLAIDDPDARTRVQDRLVELAILDEPFQEISESQREDVREEMLDPDQLGADEYPRIRLRTGRIEDTGSGDHPFRIEVDVELRDQIVTVEFSARIVDSGDNRIRIEAMGDARFTDFGIEPYRAFLGAVQNRDEFHFYLDLVAERRD